MKIKTVFILFLALVSVVHIDPLHAQPDEFTYQGLLHDNSSPATGVFDMEFRVFDVEIKGLQLRPALTIEDVQVADGLFSVDLDLGPVFTGEDRYLEISVRAGASTRNYTTLSPRQKLTSAPYAITAGSLTGTLPSDSLSGDYTGTVNLSNPLNRLSGNASSLTQINASQLKSGTVPESRLSENVARLDAAQVFTADTVFTADVGIGAQPPTQRLDVNGRVRIRGGSPGSGKVLTGDANGNATWSPQKASTLVVVVDASGGGNYTTIDAALAAISPTASQPYIVEVRPGTYTERVVMKSHVHLRGSGIESTIVLFDPTGVSVDEDFAVVRLNQLENVAISHLTLAGRSFVDPAEDFDDAVGILDQGSSPTVRNIRVTTLLGNQFNEFAVEVFGIGSINSQPLIEDCVFDTLNASDGISLVDSSARVTGNRFGEMWHAVTLTRSSALIGNNTISNTSEAVYIADSQSSATIAHNVFRTIDSGGRAIDNKGDVRVVGNEIVGNFEYGILNEGTAMVSANLFEVTGGSAIVDGQSTDSTYSANHFRNCGGSGERAVVLIDSYSVFVGNTFTGSPFGDINVAGGNPIMNNNRTTGVVSGGVTIAGFAGVAIGATTNELYLNAPLTIASTTATVTGGVAGFPEVMVHAQRSGSSHTAVSVDAVAGRDSILYLAEDGDARWGIRHDVSDAGELDIRYHKPAGGTVDALQLSTTGTLTTAGAVNPPSDRNMKQAFSPTRPDDVLEKISAIPIQTWTYKQSPDVRHIGPMAQDFHAAFGFGEDNRHIATVDADGVALAAIQGLNQKLERVRNDLNDRDAEIADLRTVVTELKQLVEALNERQQSGIR